MSVQVCRNPECGKVRRKLADGRTEGGRGLCLACETRWRRAGCPGVVPGPVPHAERLYARRAASRRERYGLLREAGFSGWLAGYRLGVGERTRQRYERAWTASRQDHREEVAA